MSDTSPSARLRRRVVEGTDGHVFPRVIVLDPIRDSKASRRAEIAALDDDALGEDDARMRFGARDRIADRATLDHHLLTASEARLDAIEHEIVRDGIRPVDRWP